MDKLKTVSTTSPKIFRWKAETIWLNVRKLFENFNSVEREMSSANCSYGDVKWSFDGTAEIFPTKGPKIFAQGPKKLGKHRFLKKMFFRKLFLWTSRIEFWHTLRNFFEKRPKSFFSMCKINLKNLKFSEHCLSSDCSYGDVKCKFDNPSKSFSEKGQKFLAQGLKLIQKFKKFVFLLIVPMDKLKTVSTTSPEKFRWKAETIWLNVRKWFENFNFVGKRFLFSTKCSYGDVEWNFDAPP